ncbi:FadR/GntR family transcriptional regulator [Cryptosporangium aurantiacum]|uniref:Transcriptional regulator, GntR family n=1 Tax=Cryptosporangium aurantiacum TaxID=134849 RepID=A0A1M7R463_9ACTN|nr:FCD domain-containing protein [Cryptosporangium aurantiacum]SHN39750.1 transcriptional regulator, GntR family [Cryptosporangium aurantiacum]
MTVAADADSTAEDPDPGRAGEPGIGRLAVQVARRIEADVVRRGWPVGESLGSEPELRQRHEVSRSVLREAVRLVEHHQVARMRRGPNGGLFVKAPDAGPAARAIVIYLEYVGTTVADLMEARRLLEPVAAVLAAQNLTEDGITLVRGAVDAGSIIDPPEPGSAETLHVVLGRLSANPALQLFIDVLIRLTTRFAVPVKASPRELRQARAEAIRRHADIADAVIAGNGGKAEARLAAYLDGVSSWMRTNSLGAAHGRTVPVVGRVRTGEPKAKLAEVVAEQLREEIAASGWPVGSVLGSETDLLSRYRISRAVLREAVRLLECHSVARMRRGPGGGLVVGVPDPQASIDSIALYLEFKRVSGADLVAVRDAIELGIVTRVVERHDQSGITERLERAVRWISEGPDDDQDNADHFHTVLAEVAGNPVLLLFLRVLTQLWRRHSGTERADTGPATRAGVEHVHRRIAEAVLAGDEALARHRMRRHLAVLTEWWH